MRPLAGLLVVSIVRRGRARATSVGLACALLSCGGGVPGAMTAADAPSLADADGRVATCEAVSDKLNPFIVEWPGTSMSQLSSVSQQRVVVVSYDGCKSLKLLDGCDLGGSYTLQRTAKFEDELTISNARELWAKLPIGAAELSGKLAQGMSFKLKYTSRGRREAAGVSRMALPRGAACDGATHYVRAITVGSFELSAAARTEGSAGGAIAGLGAGASAEGQSAHRKSGSCDDVASACSSLQLALEPLASLAEAARPAPPKPSPAAARPAAAPPPVAAAPAPRAVGAGDMIAVPAGSFSMGAREGSADASPEVQVAAFTIDRTEVTVAAYEACVSAGACSATDSGEFCNAGRPDRATHPVNCVDWHQASAYCAWAGKRLPTEQEWEYAARGDDARGFPWGNEEVGARACWNRWSSRLGTCPVGSHPRGASPFGVLDMAGNVGEWTASEHDAGARVDRGGSWHDALPVALRSVTRHGSAPTDRDGDLGLRCAR